MPRKVPQDQSDLEQFMLEMDLLQIDYEVDDEGVTFPTSDGHVVRFRFDDNGDFVRVEVVNA